MPTKTPPPVVRKIVHLRWKQRLGPVQIADRVGVAASTVHAVLVRCRLNRLSYLDRVTGEPIRRYEHPYPGSLIHVDVTSSARARRWRVEGRGFGWCLGERSGGAGQKPTQESTLCSDLTTDGARAVGVCRGVFT